MCGSGPGGSAVVRVVRSGSPTKSRSHPVTLSDQTDGSGEDLAAQRRARVEAYKRQRTEALAALGVTRPESVLLATLHYGLAAPPEDLPLWAAGEDNSTYGPQVTEADCRVALADCLAKGWVQVLDEPTLARIRDGLRTGGVLGPICGGLPEVGHVDFTEAGVALFHRLCERPPSGAASYIDVVHEKTAWFGRTAVAVSAAVEEFHRCDDVIALTEPTPTGPWRAQWWRRFPEGYRTDVEERRQWQGRGFGGSEGCHFDRSARDTDPARLRDVLDRHNVTPTEWLLLEHIEGGPFRAVRLLFPRWVAESGRQLFGLDVSEDQCREALEACLRYGWLRVTDARTTEEVRLLLRDDSALLALPRTAERRPQECSYGLDPHRTGELVPVPFSASYYWGEIDFSPAGATLYRAISAAWLGPDWENDLRVSRAYYREEHHYSEAQNGFERIVQEHVAKGDVVRASRVVPIGPWCAWWWERFPAGHRLELELGDP